MNSSPTVFKTRVGNTFFGLYIGMLLITLILTAVMLMSQKDTYIFLIMTPIFVIAFLLVGLSFFLMKLIIKDGFLFVHLFYDLYKVDIKTITTIHTGKTMWFGIHKHGTATNGLLVSSQFKNDVYITPKDEDLFFQKLLEINPNINIEKG